MAVKCLCLNPVLNWVFKYRKNSQHIKTLHTRWAMKALEDCRKGYEKLEGNLDVL